MALAQHEVSQWLETGNRTIGPAETWQFGRECGKATLVGARSDRNRTLAPAAGDGDDAGDPPVGDASRLADRPPVPQIRAVPFHRRRVTASPAGLAEALRDRYLLERELGVGGMATVYRRLGLVLLLLLSTLFRPLQSQTPGSPPPPVRVATVTAGVGNSMGWFGLQGERYFAVDRLSAFLGLGYTFSIDEGDPSGLTLAAGLRGFTPGIKHRGFLEAAVCQIFIERGFGFDRENGRFYGPCVQAGYQFASRGGFTTMLSLGLGYAPGVPESESGFGALVNLGLGYTWRRRARD